MAKKRKKAAPRRRATRSRGKVGFVNTSLLVDFAAGAGGYIAGKLAGKFIPIQNDLAKAGIKIIAAAFVPKLVKGSAGTALAIGMGISGVQDLANKFAPSLMAGVDDDLVLISGADEIGEVDTLSGIEDVNTLSGAPDSLGMVTLM